MAAPSTRSLNEANVTDCIGMMRMTIRDPAASDAGSSERRARAASRGPPHRRRRRSPSRRPGSLDHRSRPSTPWTPGPRPSGTPPAISGVTNSARRRRHSESSSQASWHALRSMRVGHVNRIAALPRSFRRSPRRRPWPPAGFGLASVFCFWAALRRLSLRRRPRRCVLVCRIMRPCLTEAVRSPGHYLGCCLLLRGTAARSYLTALRLCSPAHFLVQAWLRSAKRQAI